MGQLNDILRYNKNLRDYLPMVAAVCKEWRHAALHALTFIQSRIRPLGSIGPQAAIPAADRVPARYYLSGWTLALKHASHCLTFEDLGRLTVVSKETVRSALREVITSVQRWAAQRCKSPSLARYNILAIINLENHNLSFQLAVSIATNTIPMNSIGTGAFTNIVNVYYINYHMVYNALNNLHIGPITWLLNYLIVVQFGKVIIRISRDDFIALLETYRYEYPNGHWKLTKNRFIGVTDNTIYASEFITLRNWFNEYVDALK